MPISKTYTNPWNADLTEQDVRQILAGDDEYEREGTGAWSDVR